MKMDDDTGGDLDEIWLYEMPVTYRLFLNESILQKHEQVGTAKN